jgi:SpoVK/Ycf46/Vps4 family AAA+-type ATPase
LILLKINDFITGVDDMADIEREFVHLARLVVSGRPQDMITLIRKNLRLMMMGDRHELREPAKQVMALLAVPGATVRGLASQALPVDADSRLELLRREDEPELVTVPVWAPSISKILHELVEERQRISELKDAGLGPSRSALFVGPPGVGKTMAARWLARALGLPLLTLDLAAVMSSYLGRTGNNIRAVLDFARRSPSVLLLDEFDAIAKRRDDSAEVGELKRLVTVLLQAVDEWPSDGLLLAATNHPELLDPAVWRRFDRVVQFPLPTSTDMVQLIREQVGNISIKSQLLDAMALVYAGESHSEIARKVGAARRESVLKGTKIEAVLGDAIGQACRDCDQKTKLQVAEVLDSIGFSQRQIHDFTGLARDTIRRHREATSTSKPKSPRRKS